MALYKSNNPLREIRAEEFAQFLVEKGVKHECPMCGGPSGLNVRDDPDIVALASHPVVGVGKEGTAETIEGQTIVVATVSCGNCGYMRTFVADVIVDWLNARNNE